MKDNAKVYYDRVAVKEAEKLCPSCFPQPPSFSAWIDK